MKPEDERRRPSDDPSSQQPPQDGAPVDDAAAQEALDALRRLPPIQAADIVRARARQAFLRGSAPQVSSRQAQRQAEDAAAVDRPVPGDAARGRLQAEPLRSGRVVVPLNPRRPNRLAPIAFAAAVILVLLGYGAQAPHPWRVMDIVDPQHQLDGRGDVAIGGTVDSGMLESPADGEIDLALGGMLHMRLSPGTRIMLPKAPRRWNPRTMSIEVQAGELFCSTAGQQLPTTLDVFTDNLTARVTGTTFSVWRNPEGTCVCLLEGRVMVMPSGGASQSVSVPEGSKVVLFDDGRPHLIEPINSMERAKLQMLRDTAHP